MSNSPALTFETAADIASRAMGATGQARVAVVVLDHAGHELVVQRHHEAFPSTVAIARAKAFTALNFGRPTHEMAERLGTVEYALQVSMADPRLSFLKGGIPVLVDDRVVGSIGVSGGSADQDLEIARVGHDSS